jgi:hypothetical protein
MLTFLYDDIVIPVSPYNVSYLQMLTFRMMTLSFQLVLKYLSTNWNDNVIIQECEHL